MTLYISGLNGSIDKGLGKYLTDKKLITDFIVLDLTFQELKFNEQIKLIKDKIQNNSSDTIQIIAVSFGAYLLLNSFIDSITKVKSILLISPVLGFVSLKQGGRIPKNYNIFSKAIKNKTLNLPLETKIIYGSDDFICSEESVNYFTSFFPTTTIFKIENGGHNLPHEIVESEIIEFLKN